MKKILMHGVSKTLGGLGSKWPTYATAVTHSHWLESKKGEGNLSPVSIKKSLKEGMFPSQNKTFISEEQNKWQFVPAINGVCCGAFWSIGDHKDTIPITSP